MCKNKTHYLIMKLNLKTNPKVIFVKKINIKNALISCFLVPKNKRANNQ